MKKNIFTVVLLFFTACEFHDISVTDLGSGCNTPYSPSNVYASAESSNSISISWNSVSNTDYYEVYRSTSSYGTYSYVGRTDYTYYTDYPLSANTTYYYKIKAVNFCGNESAPSSYDYATTECDIPSAPSSVYASAESSNSISISWNSVSNTDYYEVYRSTSSYGTYSYVRRTDYTYYTDYPLLANTTYYYKIKAVNFCGNESELSYSYDYATTY